jgi:acyl transferase domain-containing protein
MSGAFPGAKSLGEFYSSLCEGREMIRFLTPEEQSGEGKGPLEHDANFVPAIAAMDGVDLFDAAFFGMTGQEAELTDPQHRLLLEHSWRALEHAGYDSHRYPGSIGVFGGATINTYLICNIAANPHVMAVADPLQLNIANGSDFLITRISYKLNLKGPSHTVQSACSTSLVAVHSGCRSLLDMECDMVLAGGVSVNMNFLHGYRYQDGGIMSPDGHCRVFDARARGTVFGSGVGVVVLKRLEDALTDGDTIHAVIKGSAINNDGGLKAGYTAPSVEGQAEVVAEAIANAGIDPASMNYIECHGTGTLLGDPVEVRALSKAFRSATARQGFCALGSVKSNLGHLDAAAGVTGLIKVVLSLKHGLLPPSLHFDQPNPQIDFQRSPFYVNTRLKEWKREGGPRRAGVSAFGVGGTNAHVVVEEAPPSTVGEPGRGWQLLTLSGRTESALQQIMKNLARHLESEEKLDVADVGYTLQVGRRPFAWRWSGVCRNREDAVRQLEAGLAGGSGGGGEEGKQRQVAFLFPGQGSQYAGMGEELYENEPVFRRSLQQSSEMLKPYLGLDLCRALYEEKTEEVNETYLAQPALLAVEYGLAQLWKSWGVEPGAMLGHSIGEYTAACLAGVMSVEEGLRVVAARGRLMQEMGRGAMLAVGLGEKQLGWIEEKGISIAAVNGPELCAVAGTEEEIGGLERELKERGVEYKRLRTRHGFHSRQVEPMMGAFLEEMKQVKLKAPERRYMSNVTGRWIEEEEARSAEYWVRHMRERVRFAGGLKELVESGEWMLVETGPGQSLRRLAQRQGVGGMTVSSLPGERGAGSEIAAMLGAAGQLWQEGIEIDWKGLHEGSRRRRVPLPTYPFERKRYWIDPASRPRAAHEEEPVVAVPARQKEETYAPRPLLRNSYVVPQNEAEQKAVAILERALGIRPIGVTDQYGELGGDSLTAVRVIDQFNLAFRSSLRVVDLYAGLTIRDLMRLVGSGPPESNGLPESSAKNDRRQIYRQGRRLLHRTEPA